MNTIITDTIAQLASLDKSLLISSHPDELLTMARLLDTAKLTPPGLEALRKHITDDKLIAVIVAAHKDPVIQTAAKKSWAAGDVSPSGIDQQTRDAVERCFETVGIVLGTIGVAVGVASFAVSVISLVIAIVGLLLAVPTGGASLAIAIIGLIVAIEAFFVGAVSLGIGIASLVTSALSAFYGTRKAIGKCTISIQAPNGDYWHAPLGGGGLLYANQKTCGGFETFRIVDLGDNKIALQAANLQLVSAIRGGGEYLTVDKDAIGEWETFGLQKRDDGKFILVTTNGRNVHADGGGGLQVTSYPGDYGRWEPMQLTVIAGVPPAALATLEMPVGIVGVGTDKNLYVRFSLSAPWVPVPNSGSVTAVAVKRDGSVWGIGTDSRLYKRAKLTSSAWSGPIGSGGFLGITAMSDDRLLGVGGDMNLYTINSDGTYSQVPNSGAVTAAAVTPDGAVWGIGTDKRLYRRATLTSNWSGPIGEGVLLGITAMAGGGIVGVGTDMNLYTLFWMETWTETPISMPGFGGVLFPGLSFPANGTWTQVPNSGSVTAVSGIPELC